MNGSMAKMLEMDGSIAKMLEMDGSIVKMLEMDGSMAKKLEMDGSVSDFARKGRFGRFGQNWGVWRFGLGRGVRFGSVRFAVRFVVRFVVRFGFDFWVISVHFTLEVIHVVKNVFWGA